ncbi:putative phage abortive infection protein [Phocaeicola sp.]
MNHLKNRTSENNSEDRIKRNVIIILFVAILLVIVFAVAFIIMFSSQDFSDKISDWGNFGDYIGGISGGLFACISAILVYYTFRSQSLSNQEQMRLNRKQSFDNIFFELLKIQKKLFEENAQNIDKILKYLTSSWGNEKIEDRQVCIKIIYEGYEYAGKAYDLIQKNQCFRHLYYLLMQVEENKDLTAIEKNRYYCFIESQMSNKELSATLLNVIWYAKKSDNFTYLTFLDKTSFFENVITTNNFLFTSIHKSVLSHTKWKNSCRITRKV